MQEFLNTLSENIIYNKHEIKGDTIHIFCETKLDKTKSVHQTMEKEVKDLPFANYKTILHVTYRRYKVKDENIKKITITEELDFLNSTKRYTKRLEEYVYNLTKENNFIGTERILKKNIINISDSTLLRIFKKKQFQ